MNKKELENRLYKIECELIENLMFRSMLKKEKKKIKKKLGGKQQ